MELFFLQCVMSKNWFYQTCLSFWGKPQQHDGDDLVCFVDTFYYTSRQLMEIIEIEQWETLTSLW